MQELLLRSARLHVAITRGYRTAKRDQNARYFTYVLLLQGGHLYVGSSDNIYRRMLEHFTMSPSSAIWVKQHGPVERVLEITVNSTVDDERYKTLEYMSLFGWEKCRGGGWCRTDVNGPPAALATFRRDRLDFEALSRHEIDEVVAAVRDMAAEMAAE